MGLFCFLVTAVPGTPETVLDKQSFIGCAWHYQRGHVSQLNSEDRAQLDTAVTLNGRPLNPPQQFPIESGQTYELIICASR